MTNNVPHPVGPEYVSVRRAPLTAEERSLALSLPPEVRLGTLGWTSPGYVGAFYDATSGVKRLFSGGLPELARHPLVRVVSLERSYVKPYNEEELRMIAAAPGPDAPLEFALRLPARLTDPYLRDAKGRITAPNPDYGDVRMLAKEALDEPLLILGEHLRVVLLEIGPHPLEDIRGAGYFTSLERALALVAAVAERLPERAVLGVEWRNVAFLTKRMLEGLHEIGAVPVMSLHPTMPNALRQSRALEYFHSLFSTVPVDGPAGPFSNAPGEPPLGAPFICRWSLSPSLARPLRSPEMRNAWVASDPMTRAVIAKWLLRARNAGLPGWVMVGNRAEGRAHDTLVALARAYGVERRRTFE